MGRRRGLGAEGGRVVGGRLVAGREAGRPRGIAVRRLRHAGRPGPPPQLLGGGANQKRMLRGVALAESSRNLSPSTAGTSQRSLGECQFPGGQIKVQCIYSKTTFKYSCL